MNNDALRDSQLMIYDTFGRLVFKSANLVDLHSINTSFWDDGIYVINVFQNLQLKSYKLLKIAN